MARRVMDQDFLHKVRGSFDYNPKTGSLIWLPRPPDFFEDSPKKTAKAKSKAFNTAFAGKPFGTLCKHGYVQGSMLGRSYYAHQICWFLHAGEWPTGVIDHINGKADDNRVENLRHVTQSQNCRNSKASGRGEYNGVRQQPSGRWSAKISLSGGAIHLGTFDSADCASRARRAIEKELGFTNRHGYESI